MFLRVPVFLILLWAVSACCGAENSNGIVSERAALFLPAAGQELSVSAGYSLAATNIYGGEAPGVYIYSLPSLTEVGRIPGVWGCVAVRPDGAQVACGGAGQVVHVWDRSTGAITNLNTGPNQKASSYFYSTNQVAFSPDSQSLVIATGYVVSSGTSFGATNWLQRYSTADLAAPHTYFFTKSNSFNDIQFTPDGSKIVVGMGAKGFRIVYPNFPCQMWGTSYAIVDAATGTGLVIPTGESHSSVSTDGSSIALTCANCTGYRVIVQDLATQATTLELPFAFAGREVQLIAGGYLAVRDLGEIVVYAGATEKRRYAMPLKSMSDDSFQPLGSARQLLVLESTEEQARLVLLEDTFWGEASGTIAVEAGPSPAQQGQGVFLDVVSMVDLDGTPSVAVGGQDAHLIRASDARHFTYAYAVPGDASPGAMMIDVAARTALGETIFGSSDALSVVKKVCPVSIPCPALDPQGVLLAAYWDGSGAVPGADWDTLDIDGAGIADRFEAALIGAILCDNSAWSEVVCAYAQNVETFGIELQAAIGATAATELIPALLCVGAEMRAALHALGVRGAYAFASEAKTLDGPLSPGGDADGDGITNLQEYLNVIADGGNTADYVAAALNPLLDGTTASAESLPLGQAGVLGAALMLLATGAACLRRRRHVASDI